MKRPYFFSKERSHLKEIFCGKAHDSNIRPPFPFENYSVREDKGCSYKYLRSTVGTLYFSKDEGFDTQKIPLGFNLTPFPILKPEDSSLGGVKLEKNNFEKIFCKKCNGVPFDNNSVKDMVETGKNGFYCGFCGGWVKTEKKHFLGVESVNEQIGSYEIGFIDDEKKDETHGKNLIFVFELDRENCEDFFLLSDEFLVDTFNQDFECEGSINFCVILAVNGRLFLIDGDLREEKQIVIFFNFQFFINFQIFLNNFGLENYRNFGLQ